MQAGPNRLRSFVQRVERIREEIDALNNDVAEIYKEAKGEGWDVKAMKFVIAERARAAKDKAKFDEFNSIVELYRDALQGGIEYATRAHAHEESDPAPRPQGAAASARTAEATGDGVPHLASSPKNLNPASLSNRDVSAGEKASSMAGPQAEAMHAGTGSEMLAVRDGNLTPSGADTGSGMGTAAHDFKSALAASTGVESDGGGSVPRVEPSPVISMTSTEPANSAGQTEDDLEIPAFLRRAKA